MKQLLLVVVIHALIFHQYLKDKKESLAPLNREPIKTIDYSRAQNSLQAAEIITYDSLLFSVQPGVLQHPYTISIQPTQFWINGNLTYR